MITEIITSLIFICLFIVALYVVGYLVMVVWALFFEKEEPSSFSPDEEQRTRDETYEDSLTKYGGELC